MVAVQHQMAGRKDQARKQFLCALELEPHDANALHLIGKVEHESGAHQSALKYFELALRECRPDAVTVRASTEHLKGESLRALGRCEEALLSYDKALALRPEHASTLNNKGAALRKLGRWDAAERVLCRALAIKPDMAEAHINLGNVLRARGADRQAADAYAQAVLYNPRLPAAHNNLGNALRGTGKFDAAIASYERALAILPDSVEVLINLYLLCRAACAWRHADSAAKRLDSIADPARGRAGRAVEPLHVYALRTDDLSKLLRHAMAICHNAEPTEPVRPKVRCLPRRIRPVIGYLVNLDNRPDVLRMEKLLQWHQNEAFDLKVFMTRGTHGSKQPIINGAAWYDVGSLSDDDAAAFIADRRLDLLVDLAGHQSGNRIGILLRSPSVRQVSWPMICLPPGTPVIDTLVSDGITVPLGETLPYHQRITRLAAGHQVLAHDCVPVAVGRDRDDAGLPECAFVLACFAKPVNFSAAAIDRWFSAMVRIPHAVLWLGRMNPGAIDRLRRAAELHGLNAERIIYASRCSTKAQHLARLRCADLVLDTGSFGGLTASLDALWAGVPVIAMPSSLAWHRAIDSVLHGLALPELVAPSASAYVEQIVAFATTDDRRHLAMARQHLATLRDNGRLFSASPIVHEFESMALRLCQE